MLAVVKDAPEVGAIRVREVPDPEPGENEVLVDVRAASICGSDLHIWHWDPIISAVLTPPRVIGHEVSGVLAGGDPGEGFREGDRVLVESVVSCGRCPRCRRGRPFICDNFRVRGVHQDGAMAERMVTHRQYLHHLPDGLPFEHAAVVEPASVAMHAVLARGEPKAGDLVLVTGPGPIGMLAAQIARACGAEVVVAGAEIDAQTRLPIAAQLGFKTLNTQREPINDGLRRLVGRERADLAFECAGAPAAFQAVIEGTEKGSTIVIVALYSGPFPIDPSVAVRRELDLRASYCASWDDYERSIAFIANGTIQVEPLIARFPLEDAVDAFGRALEKQVMKPVLVRG